MAKYSSESEALSDFVNSSDNFHIVPSTDEKVSQPRDEKEEEREEDVESIKVEEQVPVIYNPVIVFFVNAIKLMLLPFCKIFFAPTVQRTFVKTTVLVLTLSSIVITGLFAYILFYNKYVPPITHVQPIWFHYVAIQGPQAIVNVATEKSVPLRHHQVYDVSVQLRVPTSDINFSIGNFMIDIQLQTSNGSTIVRSSRPAILRYQSRAQRIMRVFTKAIPLLVGLSEESQMINTRLIDSYTELKDKPVSQVKISISDPRIQIYDAKLLILAKFNGLRYYMYFHGIITALSFIIMFSVIEFVCAAIAWKGFGAHLWCKMYQLLKDQENTSVLSVSDVTDNTHDAQFVEGSSASDKSYSM